MRTNKTRTEPHAADIRELTNEELESVSGGMNSFWQAVNDGFVNACTSYYAPTAGPYFLSCTADLKH